MRIRRSLICAVLVGAVCSVLFLEGQSDSGIVSRVMHSMPDEIDGAALVDLGVSSANHSREPGRFAINASSSGVASLEGHIRHGDGTPFLGEFTVTADSGVIHGPFFGPHFNITFESSHSTTARFSSPGYGDVLHPLDRNNESPNSANSITMLAKYHHTINVVNQSSQPIAHAALHIRPYDFTTKRERESFRLASADSSGLTKVRPFGSAWLWAVDVGTGVASKPVYVENPLSATTLVIEDSKCTLGITLSLEQPNGKVPPTLIALRSLERGTVAHLEIDSNGTEFLELPMGSYTLSVGESPVQIIDPPLLPGTDGPQLDLNVEFAEVTLAGVLVGGWNLAIHSNDPSKLLAPHQVETFYRIFYEAEEPRDLIHRSIMPKSREGKLHAFLPHFSGFSGEFRGEIDLILWSSSFERTSVRLPLESCLDGMPISVPVTAIGVEEAISVTFLGVDREPFLTQAQLVKQAGVEAVSQGRPSETHLVFRDRLSPGDEMNVRPYGAKRWMRVTPDWTHAKKLGRVEIDLSGQLGTLTVTSKEDLTWDDLFVSSSAAGTWRISPHHRRVGNGLFSAEFINIAPGPYSVMLRRSSWPTSLSVGEVNVPAGSSVESGIICPPEETDRLSTLRLPLLPLGATGFCLERWTRHGAGSWSMKPSERVFSRGDHTAIQCPTDWLEDGLALLSLLQPSASPIPVSAIDSETIVQDASFNQHQLVGDERHLKIAPRVGENNDLPHARSRIRLDSWRDSRSIILPHGSYYVSRTDTEWLGKDVRKILVD